MKKSAKKLTISRETIRTLQEIGLEAVNGGVTDSSCAFSCDPYTARICPTGSNRIDC
jgi:hypothetical protein